MVAAIQETVRLQWVASQAEKEAALLELEERVLTQLAELGRCHPDFGMMALERFGVLPVPIGEPSPDSDWHVLRTLARCGLQASWEGRHQPGGQHRADALTAAVLALVAVDAPRAEALGQGLLADQPYLGLPHEEAVLHLVESAATREGFRQVAGALLTTLWRNLQARQERPSKQLETLALLYLDDANPALRQAACVHLLLHGDPGIRDTVIQEVVRRGERELARQLAVAAADHMRGRLAVATVARLVPLLGMHASGAAARLAQHSPEALRHSYEQHLADGRSPALRMHWVTGGAMRSSPEGIALAQRAMERDPDGQVQERAMFALTAHANADLAGDSLRRLVARAERLEDSAALGAVLLGLKNALGAGHVGLVQQMVADLHGHRLLGPGDRTRLGELAAAAAR